MVERMKVLYVEPLASPRVIDTELSLENIHSLVHGDIFQAIYPYEELVAVLLSDTGKLDGLPPNRVVGRDIIAGPFLVVGIGDEDFTSLSEDLVKKFYEVFKYPELFLNTPDGIAVIKLMEETI